MATLLEQHCERWAGGCELTHCAKVGKRVLGRGAVPCDVLFIGDGPGLEEDTVGLPFAGSVGKLLDWIIRRASGWREGNPPRWTHALTNLVACLPRGENAGKVAESREEQLRACSPRLQEFIDLCHPKLIVCVGQVVEERLRLSQDVPRIVIVHPADILQVSAVQRRLITLRCISTIRDAAEDVLAGRTPHCPKTGDRRIIIGEWYADMATIAFSAMLLCHNEEVKAPNELRGHYEPLELGTWHVNGTAIRVEQGIHESHPSSHSNQGGQMFIDFLDACLQGTGSMEERIVAAASSGRGALPSVPRIAFTPKGN